jgi:hypothetical protein
VRSTSSLAFSGAWGPQGYVAAHVARVCRRYCCRYRPESPRHPPDCPRRSRHCPGCPRRSWSSSQPHHSKRHLRPNSHHPHRLRRLLLRRVAVKCLQSGERIAARLHAVLPALMPLTMRPTGLSSPVDKGPPRPDDLRRRQAAHQDFLVFFLVGFRLA